MCFSGWEYDGFEKGFINVVRGACVALFLVEMLHHAFLSASTNGRLSNVPMSFPLFCSPNSFYGLRNCSWRYHTARKLLKKTRCLELDLWDWKWAGTLDCNRFWEQQGSLYSFWVVFFQAINTFSWIYAYGDKALPSIYKGMEVSNVSLLVYYIHTGL